MGTINIQQGIFNFHYSVVDSKNIFIACSFMLDKVDWEPQSKESEWYYFGEGKNFKLNLIQSNIDQFFSEQTIYLVTDRHKSKEISIQTATQEIKKALSDFSEVTLCNKNFERFISFNSIGVARQGVYN